MGTFNLFHVCMYIYIYCIYTYRIFGGPVDSRNNIRDLSPEECSPEWGIYVYMYVCCLTVTGEFDSSVGCSVFLFWQENKTPDSFPASHCTSVLVAFSQSHAPCRSYLIQ